MGEISARWRCVARLDYDSRADVREGLARMRWVLSVAEANGFYSGPFRLYRHKTRRGYHLELQAQIALPPSQMIALQAILGSDYRRETFNFFRARVLPLAPGFWWHLGHWNVLHRGSYAKTNTE